MEGHKNCYFQLVYIFIKISSKIDRYQINKFNITTVTKCIDILKFILIGFIQYRRVNLNDIL